MCRIQFNFKRKPDQSGNGLFVKYRGRLDARGFTMTEGIGFENTFASTASSTSLLTIIALAAQHGLLLRQGDFVAAYLNETTDHEVYMKLPDGSVRRLIKAIYGTKQGAERWEQARNAMLTSIDFIRTIADPSVFTRRKEDCFAKICIHPTTSSSLVTTLPYIDQIVRKMNSFYELVDHVEPSLLLGMRITRTNREGPIFLDRAQYVEELISRFNMTSCNAISTPHQPGLYLSKAMSPSDEAVREDMKRFPYLSLLGGLMWLA